MFWSVTMEYVHTRNWILDLFHLQHMFADPPRFPTNWLNWKIWFQILFVRRVHWILGRMNILKLHGDGRAWGVLLVKLGDCSFGGREAAFVQVVRGTGECGKGAGLGERRVRSLYMRGQVAWTVWDVAWTWRAVGGSVVEREVLLGAVFGARGAKRGSSVKTLVWKRFIL